MHYQRPGIEHDQQILGASLHVSHGLTAQAGGQIFLDGPAKTSVAHDEIGNTTANESGRYTAPRSFDFRKLGQELNLGGEVGRPAAT
jgi:hypothetical protein